MTEHASAVAEAHGHDDHGHGEDMLVGYDGKLHPSRLQHHFVSAEQQFEASKLGMWLFLVTEILLFGGMFVAYAIFRAWYPELYAEASTQLDTMMGALNTMVLLVSSLTVAWAIRGAQTDNQKVLFWNLIATVALAGTFMVVKYFEYTHKFDLGIYPGEYFVLPDGRTIGELGPLDRSDYLVPLTDAEVAAYDAAPAEHAPAEGEHDSAQDDHASDDHGEAHGPGSHGLTNPRSGIFFSIYYVMTGIHGLHVVIGMIAISILAWKARRGKYSSVYYTPVENVGLYWHVVDIIWIFLFPLMYLI
ncbi:MAG: cytochrome c oxidase subunit 3 family protein [Rubricoccaceae bacterium]|nr:cytochrome c oxidase subunit 3 family protein [Rubricoccaceae bacterium]